MADYTINLKISEATLYVSKEQYALLVQKNKTVKWHAVDAEFTITMWNADQFFVGVQSFLQFTIAQGSDSDTYTIKDLLLRSEQEYFIYCVDDKKTGDAPPKIIIRSI